jgi:hypothetical protein
MHKLLDLPERKHKLMMLTLCQRFISPSPLGALPGLYLITYTLRRESTSGTACFLCQPLFFYYHRQTGSFISCADSIMQQKGGNIIDNRKQFLLPPLILCAMKSDCFNAFEVDKCVSLQIDAAIHSNPLLPPFILVTGWKIEEDKKS